MTRRLGASIPPALRLRAFESRIRELADAAETLAAAAELLEREGTGLEDLLRAAATVEAIAHRPFRRPRGIPAPSRRRREYRQLRTFDSPGDAP